MCPATASIQLLNGQHTGNTSVVAARILRKRDFLLPSPGVRRMERLREKFGAVQATLTKEELAQMEAALTHIKIHGNRTEADIAGLFSQL